MPQHVLVPLTCLVALCSAAPAAAPCLTGSLVAEAAKAAGASPVASPVETPALLRADADGRQDGGRAKLALQPGRVVAGVGERFAVDVYVRGADGIVSVPFTLSYDPDVVAVIAVELAPGWEPSDEPTLMYEARDDGDLVVGLSLVGEGAEPLQGRRRLVRVRLIGLRPGETVLELRRSALLRPGLSRQTAKLWDARVTVRR